MLQVIPVPGIFFLVAVLTFGFILKYTAFGRYIYAIGGNEQAARLAGQQEGEARLRAAAAEGLGRMRARAARDTLVAVQNDPDETVRQRVAEALARLDSPAGIAGC